MKPLYELLSALLPILALGIGAFLVNVLLHELGHAIPLLFWSKKKVLVYIGSLGDPKGSFRLSFGRLELCVKYNPFLWMRGLCQPGERLRVGRMMFYTAMGPLVSLLLTIIPFVLLKTIQPDERQTIILVTFMAIGAMFTLSSAIPRGRLSPTHSGGGVRNDATQVINLWKTRNLPDSYWKAMEKLGAKAYPEAAALLEEAIGEGHTSASLYRLAVVAHFYADQPERAGALQEMIRQRFRLSVEDQITDGCLLLMKGRYREAVAVYRDLVRLHYNHFLILNNMGYSLIAAGEPQESLLYLDRGIMVAPRFAELYANRAWAKMELGQWEEGLADAQQALKLNDATASAHHALGLYAREKGEWETAKEHLLKARSITSWLPFIDEPLADVERRLLQTNTGPHA